MLIQRFILAFVTSVLICACANSPPPPIMTNERFESRINPQGETEFVYGLSWRKTSRESLIAGRDEELFSTNSKKQSKGKGKKNSPQRNNQPSMFNIQANNKTKLELEDKAAASLNKRITKEKLCANGYEINKVIWKSDNLRLLGACN
ncbi:hypothetical protein [Paraglaciecola sp.]|uniref:hypothetical protein n=1 Tax=Paraglaciecola sp. TaxID=1920173 RepID=UPI003EF4CBF2